MPLPLPLILILISGALRSGGAGGSDPQGAVHGCTAFSARAGCLLGKSRRLRGPDAKRRARRRGVLSLLQVSLHKQRKVARAVTARKLLILISANGRRTNPPYGLRRRASRGRSPDLRRIPWRVAKSYGEIMRRGAKSASGA